MLGAAIIFLPTLFYMLSIGSNIIGLRKINPFDKSSSERVYKQGSITCKCINHFFVIIKNVSFSIPHTKTPGFHDSVTMRF